MVTYSLFTELLNAPRLPILFNGTAGMRGRFQNCKTLSESKQLHALLIITNPSSHHRQFLTLELLRWYSANDDLFSARLLFDKTPHRNTYLWNSIIRAHAVHREFLPAFSLFVQMRTSDTKPDGHTFACVLRSCSENSDPSGARMVHGLLVSSGLSSDHIVSSSLVSAYSKLGLVDDAEKSFEETLEPDLVLWNSMILSYGYSGNWQKGMEMFHRMRASGENPDGYSLVGLISCFWDPSTVRIGRGIHGFCVKRGFDTSEHVRSSLLSMYSRCNCVDSGYRIFRALQNPDLVTWSAMITGLSQMGKWKEAINLFREMRMTSSDKTPDTVLIAALLSACASVATIGHCKEIHSFVFRHRLDHDIAVSCALINTYSKCGFTESGFQVFGTMPKKNLIAYNTIISSLGSHGLGREALCAFDELLNEGFKPEGDTFSAVLCACCHSGLIESGLDLFRRMDNEFGMKAQMEHYVYIVKLLGCGGMLEEAYELVQTMPMLPDSGVWGAMLWACSANGRSDLAEIAAGRLFEIDPRKTAYRIILSNMYASEEKWGDVENLRDGMMERSMNKIPGHSWIGDYSNSK